MPQIDADAFHKAFQSALPQHTDSHVQMLASVGAPAPATASGSFCDLFPKIESTIESILAIPFLSWFVPGYAIYAPAIRAFLAAAKATLLPAICPTK